LVEKLMQGLDASAETEAGQQVAVGETQEKSEIVTDPAAQIAFLLGSMGVVQTATNTMPTEVTVASNDVSKSTGEVQATQQIIPTVETQMTEQTEAAEGQPADVVEGQTAQAEAQAAPQQETKASEQVAEVVEGKETPKTAGSVTVAPETVAAKTAVVPQKDDTQGEVTSEAAKTEKTDAKAQADRKDETHSGHNPAREGLIVGAAVDARAQIAEARVGQSQADASSVSGVEDVLSKARAEAIPSVEKQSAGQDASASGQEQAAAQFARTFETAKTSVEKSEGASSLQGVHQQEQTPSARMINQIVRSAKVHTFEGGAEMTLRLDPPHLGTIQMNVAVNEGAVTASLRTSTESARQILQSDLGSLKQMLADAGVKVDQVQVSVSTNLNQQAWNPYSGSQAGAGGQGQGKAASWRGSLGLGGSAGPEIAGAAATQATMSYSSGQINFLA
jgi:flagellar hook-length control protein FliK